MPVSVSDLEARPGLQAPRLRILRTFKIGSFHIGSSFADILTSALWNRVLISDLKVMAWPVALLIALRYLLAPLSIWAGYRSDTRPLFGKHRLPYIWAGRGLMLLALPLLPLSTMLIAADLASVPGWALATLSFLLYGVGTLLSGSPFLALVRDSAPPARSGQAIGIVQLMLVLAFAVSPILYARMMPAYDPAQFWQIVLLGSAVALFFWFFSVFGEDQLRASSSTAAPEPLMPVVREIWADWRARRFMIFLALGAISAFAQDAILEPFGGDVFGLPLEATTRFNAYWGVGVLVGMIGTLIVTRRRSPAEQTLPTGLGLLLTALPLAGLSLIAITRAEALLMPMLLLFGFGFGVYTIGAVSLLVAMTIDARAGIYLGIWSMVQLVARGLGIFGGGALRDLVLHVSGSYELAYASVFGLEALGLLVCIVLLRAVDVPGFSRANRTAIGPLNALAD